MVVLAGLGAAPASATEEPQAHLSTWHSLWQAHKYNGNIKKLLLGTAGRRPFPTPVTRSCISPGLDSLMWFPTGIERLCESLQATQTEILSRLEA